MNFKKNEKAYDAANSAVFKMLQEMDKQPKEETEEDPAEMTHRAVAANPPIKSPVAAPQQQQPFVVHHQPQHQQQQPVVIHHPIQQQEHSKRAAAQDALLKTLKNY